MNISAISRQALSLAAINGFLVVTFGAFGAHVLEEKISADMLDVFNTGVQYHMFHVVALIATAGRYDGRLEVEFVGIGTSAGMAVRALGIAD